MKKTILIIISIIYFSCTYGQSKTIISMGNIEYYMSESKGINKILKSYLDTCQKLFNCPFSKKMSISPSSSFDLNGEFFISPILLIDTDFVNNRQRLGHVVLYVDSLALFVDKKLLYKSCLGDSILSSGKTSIHVDYDEFENYLIKKNMDIQVKLSCFKGKLMSVESISSFEIPRIYDEGRRRLFNFRKSKN